MTKPILDWFGARAWTLFEFQRATWDAYRAGRSGLVHAPTGIGKTYAVWLGPIAEYLAERGEKRDNRRDTERNRGVQSSAFAKQTGGLLSPE